MSSLARGGHVFPRLFDQGLSSLAIHKEVVTGLRLVTAAPPVPVRRQPVDFIAQLVARRCMPQQELVVAAGEGLALMTVLLLSS